MAREAGISWERAMKLLPIILDFYHKYSSKEDIDRGKYFDRVAAVFGIEDIGAFVKDHAQNNIGRGLREVMDEDSAQKIADILLALGTPVAQRIYAYIRGESVDTEDLLSELFDIYRDSSEGFVSVMSQSLGVEIPDEMQDIIGRYTIDAVAVFAFMAAYKIYCKAANDAELAHIRRIEIEERCSESIRLLWERHEHMETLVNNYLLEHLLPFEAGIEAMDASLVSDDDDGFIRANSQLWNLLGHDAQYHNAVEFDELMLSDETFRL